MINIQRIWIVRREEWPDSGTVFVCAGGMCRAVTSSGRCVVGGGVMVGTLDCEGYAHKTKTRLRVDMCRAATGSGRCVAEECSSA